MAIVVVVVLAVGGFIAWRWVDRTILSPPVTTIPDFFAFDELPPGPCYDFDSEGGLVSGWSDVSCEGPREAEVTYAESFLDGPYPGAELLNDSAAELCRTAFERYVGLPPGQSVYHMDWLLPTEELWAGGSRQAICLVVSDDGAPLTGTVKGSEQ